MSQADILLSIFIVFGAGILALLFGGIGYLTAMIRNANDKDFIALLEKNYDSSNETTKHVVQALQVTTKLLGASVPTL